MIEIKMYKSMIMGRHREYHCTNIKFKIITKKMRAMNTNLTWFPAHLKCLNLKDNMRIGDTVSNDVAIAVAAITPGLIGFGILKS